MLGLDWRDLAPFLILGLLGAAHCLGMCGGFAVAVSAAAGRQRWRVLRHQLAYVGGKALTYALLGLVVARAGELVARGGELVAGGGSELFAERTEALARSRELLAWLAGATMIGLGLVAWRGGGASLFGGRAGSRSPRLGAIAARLRGLFAAARSLPGASGALATGLLTGLLPCGWSWGALALAAATPPLAAFLGMGLFGLGTAPVLILVGLGWSGLSVRHRRLGQALLGPLLIVFGVLTALRGAPLFGLGAAAEVLPACCTQRGDGTHEH
jgi:sulfite exporter TauE/SafE